MRKTKADILRAAQAAQDKHVEELKLEVSRLKAKLKANKPKRALPPPAEYTLSEAIESLEKEGWEIDYDSGFLSKNENHYDLIFKLGEQYYPCAKTKLIKDFTTALDELKAAIEACNILNGAKKETL